MKKIMFDEKYYLTEAVLEKNKTMTRRFAHKIMVENENQELVWNGKFKAPQYKVGDVVAIAQRYSELSWNIKFYERLKQAYKLTNLPQYELKGWDNKMFVKAELMPHQIQITDVKLEKLQDITDEDCFKEGVRIDSRREIFDDNIYEIGVKNKKGVYLSWHFPTPKEAFSGLINMMCGKNTWNDNPWVYVYSFKLIK